MKKGLSILLALLLAGGLCGCGGAGAQQDTPKTSIRIGVSTYDGYDTFVSELMKWFAVYAGEAERRDNVSINILMESADGDQVVQTQQVEEFIEAGCDVICINLVDRADATGTIDRAKAADIPALFFNRELVPEDLERWDRLYYVGAPALDSGMIQGQIIADICREDLAAVDKNGDGVLQYVMLEGEAGHQDAIVRTESAVNRIVASGLEMERVEGGMADWNRDKAETLMTRWLEQQAGNIEVVLANNDEMALGAVAALQKAALPPGEWPLVAGIDGTPYGLAAVRDGTLAGTVYNDAPGQAKALLDIAVALANTGSPPEDMVLESGKYYRLAYHGITRSNVEEYIQKNTLPAE